MFGENTSPQFTLNLPAKLVTSKVAAWTVVSIIFALVYTFLIFVHLKCNLKTWTEIIKYLELKLCFVQVLTPVTKYAITITPVAFGIEEFLPSPQLRTYGVSILIRTILVFSTLVISLTVPYFGKYFLLTLCTCNK